MTVPGQHWGRIFLLSRCWERKGHTELTSLGITCSSTFPSTSCSLAAMGVSLAVLTVSFRTCWQYLPIHRNVNTYHVIIHVDGQKTCSDTVLVSGSTNCPGIYSIIAGHTIDKIIKDFFLRSLLPELRNLVQGNRSRSQHIIKLIIQLVLDFLWSRQEMDSPDAHWENSPKTALWVREMETTHQKAFTNSWRLSSWDEHWAMVGSLLTVSGDDTSS